MEALNHAVRGLPPERMRRHVCWGHYEGPHHRDVALGDSTTNFIDIRVWWRSGSLVEGARLASRQLWK